MRAAVPRRGPRHLCSPSSFRVLISRNYSNSNKPPHPPSVASSPSDSIKSSSLPPFHVGIDNSNSNSNSIPITATRNRQPSSKPFPSTSTSSTTTSSMPKRDGSLFLPWVAAPMRERIENLQNSSNDHANAKIKASLGGGNINAQAMLQPEEIEEFVQGGNNGGGVQLKSPREIRQHLDDYVIGQDAVKKKIAVAVYNHYLRITHNAPPQQQHPQQQQQHYTQLPHNPHHQQYHPNPHHSQSHIHNHHISQLSQRFPNVNTSVRQTSPGGPVVTTTTTISPQQDQKSTTDPRTFTGRPAPRQTPNTLFPSTPTPETDPITIDKSNVLLIGPSGSGKTLIAKTVAKLLDVPFSMNDATPLTQAGYVGEDVEVCIHRLLQNANYDISRAERGIVFLDEIDKIARKTDATNPNQRDVSGEGVQQGLLRILEGTVVSITVKPGTIPNRPRPNPNGPPNTASPNAPETFQVDTSNILFICSGAFVGLEKIVKDRLSVKGSIGFGAKIVPKEEGEESKPTRHHPVSSHRQNHHHRHKIPEKEQGMEWLDTIEPEDMIKFGFIPEFIGRVPVFATARPLTISELVRILTEPRNALTRQYEEIFKRFGIRLKFSEDGLKAIAKMAITKRTGARGLRRILETVLGDAMYDLPGSEYRFAVVDEEVVNGLKPVIVLREGEEDVFDKY